MELGLEIQKAAHSSVSGAGSRIIPADLQGD